MERITGYTVEECMDMLDYPMPMVLEDDRDMVRQWFKEGGGPTGKGDMEFRLARKDGKVIDAAVSWRPVIRADGENLGYRSSVQDVSERKGMEEALQQAFSQLTLLNRVTRHEMTHQLSILRKGFAACKSGRSPHDEKTLDNIDKSIARMDHLLRLLEEFQSVGDSAPVWQNVRDIAESVLAEVPKQIAVRVDVGELEVLADPMLERVFSNLFENSMAHGNGVKNIVIEKKATRDGMTIIFRDDGTGIPFNLKEEIFAQDFRHQPARGLILSAEILDVTGMTIRETGAPGKGARFEIDVPNDKFRIKNGKSMDED